MTFLPEGAVSGAASSSEPFEIVWVTRDGLDERLPLTEAWAVPFEHGMPVRRFRSRKGQRHLSGVWWSATTGGHVGFESWLERDHVMLLDFDPEVVGIASQPFWLIWTDETGARVLHAPDYFARCVDGSAVVIDCRPAERRPAKDLAKFESTAAACALLGWEYRLVSAVEPVVAANARWLAGYRHPRHGTAGVTAALRDAFAPGRSLMEGAEMVGDPIAVLPVLFHLLWQGGLTADLSAPLHAFTLVRSAASR